MKRIPSLKIVGAAIALALLSSAAEASITLYTDKTSFLTAAGATTTETFSAAAASTTTTTYTGAFQGFVLRSVANGNTTGITTNALASSGDNTPIPAAFVGQKYFGWGNYQGSPGASSTLTFGNASKAVGFDWFNTDFTDDDDVVVNGSTTFSEAMGFTSSGFIGILATGADVITSLLIHSNQVGGYVSDAGIDNVIVSAAKAVPEPETLALFAIALAGMVSAARRKRIGAATLA